jgi:hypothetical protein
LNNSLIDRKVKLKIYDLILTLPFDVHKTLSTKLFAEESEGLSGEDPWLTGHPRLSTWVTIVTADDSGLGSSST